MTLLGPSYRPASTGKMAVGLVDAVYTRWIWCAAEVDWEDAVRTHSRVERADTSPHRGLDADTRSHPVFARGRETTRALAYELLIDCQMASGAGSIATAWAMAEQARQQGWLDVCSIASYAALVGQWLHEPQRAANLPDVDQFVQWADAVDDPLAVALSRAARAAGGIYLDRRDNPLDDLIAAYVAAERVDAVTERAFALHEIAGSFHEMRMWELSRELFDTVATLSAGLYTPRALVGSLACNRYYTLACELLYAMEGGREDELRKRRARVDALTSQHMNPAIPAEWRSEMEAYRAICLLLLRRDDASAARVVELLRVPAPGRVSQVVGLLHCVLGWHHMEHGRWDDARPLVLDGAHRILSRTDPAFRSFALWLRARVRNRHAQGTDREALRDYRRALIDDAEHARRALTRTAQARLEIERLRVERDRFAHESQTDPLTGIANRRALDTRLRTPSPATLILVDIDRFKPVNDRFGHEVGDRVLRRVGEILRDCVRPGDLAARLGGDEFVLVLETTDADAAVRRGHEVRDRIRAEPWDDIRLDLRVAASVGVACGQLGERELYRAADTALYEAKRAGGARVRALLSTVAHPAAGAEG